MVRCPTRARDRLVLVGKCSSGRRAASSLVLVLALATVSCLKVNDEFAFSGTTGSGVDSSAAATRSATGTMGTADPTGSGSDPTSEGSVNNCTAADSDDTELSGEVLGDLEAGQSHVLQGELASDDPVDWFVSALGSSSGEPVLERISGAVTEVCLYVECESEPATITGCGSSGNAALSPMGRPGCCAPAILEAIYECPQPSDAVILYASVANSAAAVGDCEAYAVELRHG